MLKNCKWLGRALAIALSAAVITTSTVPALHAQAAVSSNTNENELIEKSLKITLEEIGTDREGVELVCYKIGEIALNNNEIASRRLIKDFEDSEVDLDKISEADGQRKAAETLEKYVRDHTEIEKLDSKESDKNGEVKFENLENGIYLIIQTSGFSSYGTMQPFVVVVPYKDPATKEWVYAVEAKPKGEDPNPPGPSESPTPSITPGTTGTPRVTPSQTNLNQGSPSKNVKTSDETPMEALISLFGISAGFICLMLVVMLRRRRN